MRVLSVYGGIPLHGETTVQGAKNSVLPILAATVLAGGPCVIHNCPHLSDVDTAMEILRWLGATVLRENETILVDPSGIERCTIPAQMMQKMRSSVLFLGSILARCGQAEISVPGGCRLGARPIDFHLEAMRTFGAEVKQQGNRSAVWPTRCRVGGTECPLQVLEPRRTACWQPWDVQERLSWRTRPVSRRLWIWHRFCAPWEQRCMAQEVPRLCSGPEHSMERYTG